MQNHKSKIKIKIKLIFIWFVAFNISIAASAGEKPQPLWATYGMLINDTPGNTPQQNPQAIADGFGNTLIVWEDGRSGYYDIYAQKIDKNGKLIWQNDGLAACCTDGNQNFPQITSDGAGGAIIVWQDYRNGNSDIFAQRLNYAGEALWGKTGIAVSTAEAGQFAPQIVTDGRGGAIITWHDYRSGKGEDIYAQRIDKNGNLLWGKEDVAVITAPGTQWYPKIESDGKGGAIIVWTDGRISSSDNNIFGQRLDPYGKTVWRKKGLLVCAAPKNQERPVISQTDDGFIVAWNDSRSGDIDIYLQKISLEGQNLWAANGVAACSLPYAQEDPKLASDGEGGAIVTWTDNRALHSDIYAQRIHSNGETAWQENGRPVNTSNGTQKNPVIIKNDKDWVLVWEDDRNGEVDLFAQKINSDGTPLWQNSGIPIVLSNGEQKAAVLSAGPAAETVVVWADQRSGNYDIYAQKIADDGNPTWRKNGVVVCAVAGSVVQQNARFIINGNGEIILAFEDGRSGHINIYTQKISNSGSLAWGYHGTAIAKVAAKQANPCIVSDKKGGAFIAWEDYRNNDKPAIRIHRLDAKGQKLWESSLAVAAVKAKQINPVMIADGKDGVIIAWQDDRDVLSLQDIYIQKIDSQGNLLWGKKGKVAISANGDQVDLTMLPDNKGGAFIAWTDYRRSDRNPDIYAQRINPEGKTLWRNDGIVVCGAPDVQKNPKLTYDNQDGIIIAWTDKGGGSYDIYAQRLNAQGKTMWMADGIPVNQLSRTQQNPQFGELNTLVWEDYRFGNWDIFASALSPAGRLPWGKEGIPIVAAPHTQYSPKIMGWRNGSSIVGWEDYRNGRYYEIYMQKLNQDGLASWQENGVRNVSLDGARRPTLLSSTTKSSFYLFWEDYTAGGKAIYGQKYIAD